MNTETQEPKRAGEVIDAIISAFDGNLAEQVADTLCGKPLFRSETPQGRLASLKCSRGWPKRIRDATDAPEGQEWHNAFHRAKAALNENATVVLHGKRGTGKTRMAGELAVGVDSTYTTAMGFFLSMRHSFKRNSELSELDALEPFKKAGLLVIDELQDRGETEWENRLLTHLVDYRYSQMLPTILIANLTRAELQASLGASICDRLAEAGCRIEFTWNSYRRA